MEPVDEAQRVWNCLLELVQGERPRGVRVAEELGLTFVDLGVLKLLGDRGGSLPMQDLAMWHDKSSITRAVHRLVERGLVERYENPADRRAKQVAITDAGRAIIDRLYAAFLAPPDALRAIDPEELRVVVKVLERVITARGGEIPYFC